MFVLGRRVVHIVVLVILAIVLNEYDCQLTEPKMRFVISNQDPYIGLNN